MRVTAVLSRGPRSPFVLAPVELDEPRPDEILVRIVASGICHTDLVVRSRAPADAPPLVLGHEGAGVVERTGSAVRGVAPGDRVLLSYRHCADCASCRRGEPAYCESMLALNNAGRRPDGSATLTRDGQPLFGSFFGQSSFASHALVTADNVVVVAEDEAKLAPLAPLGCGAQTGAGAVLNVLRPGEADTLVVYGAGSVGLSALLAARARGVRRVLAVDRLPARRAAARGLGADQTLDPDALPAGTPLAEAVREATGGGPSHALDTTGSPAVVAEALRALATRGTLAVVGLGPAELTLDVRDLLYGGKTLRGCVEGDAVPGRFLPELLALRAEGRFPVDALVTTYPFEAINEAVADQEAGRVIKPVLTW
ncbi:NAD(P)-dependent alcohol dehydrogenase [Streptomyces sp. DSM 44915]|uniref:NAD(P)-dependent alcohol dehydrogenase n=1 Tax=Streptomyces chisholmiae TaxID=3075540 RepID=A0ABU2JQC6_9ACTN|nr:NAD(P)-dependent alcohol dehydrogenase [Streptomyces sp. DSM 44915]MDT0267196.1 NAD(P)-dependent alcohol dehydrogenase [Streptomyces sp. DSM 44915]